MQRIALSSFVLVVAACGSDATPAPPGSSGAGGTSAGGGSGVSSTWGTAGAEATAGAESGGSGGGSHGGVAGSASHAGTSGAAAGTAPANTLADCELAFPYREQSPRGFWLGADSNFSVALAPSRALMTFQDSFVGGSNVDTRPGSSMVGNSVASITCEGGRYAIDYHWGGAGNEHRALFDEGREDERLWIHRPWLHQGKLFLTATRVTSDARGFHELGITLARVSNPLEAPSSWSVEYFSLTDQRLTVGKGIFETNEHVYLFTPHDNDMLLARLAKSRLLDPSISETTLEYLKSDGAWAPGLEPSGAKRLGIAANTGLTVRYHAATSRFVALFTDTRGWPSASIAISSAPALEGPWTTSTEVYSVPDMKAGSPGYDAETVCYGAAEQPLFNSRPDTHLLFTYTCNSLSFDKLLANMAIYVPRVVTVPVPELL